MRNPRDLLGARLPLVHALLAHLPDCRSRRPGDRAPPRAQRAGEKQVVGVREHYREEISVKDIASSAGVSLYYFTRLFKKLKLQSPHLYLLNLRMDEAKKLLVYTADTIDVVADKTGFQSASHFIRAFKKAMNMTPNTFRNYFSARKV